MDVPKVKCVCICSSACIYMYLSISMYLFMSMYMTFDFGNLQLQHLNTGTFDSWFSTLGNACSCVRECSMILFDLLFQCVCMCVCSGCCRLDTKCEWTQFSSKIIMWKTLGASNFWFWEHPTFDFGNIWLFPLLPHTTLQRWMFPKSKVGCSQSQKLDVPKVNSHTFTHATNPKSKVEVKRYEHSNQIRSATGTGGGPPFHDSLESWWCFKHTDRQRNRQADRQTDRETDRETDR